MACAGCVAASPLLRVGQSQPAPGLAALLLAKLRGQSYSPNAGVAFQLQHQHAPNQTLFRALARLPGPWETCAGALAAAGAPEEGAGHRGSAPGDGGTLLCWAFGGPAGECAVQCCLPASREGIWAATGAGKGERGGQGLGSPARQGSWGAWLAQLAGRRLRGSVTAGYKYTRGARRGGAATAGAKGQG